MIAAAWLQPWRQCTLYVCSNFKPLCCEVNSASIMYASMLCCHCGPFVSVAVQISARHKVLVSYRSIFLHEIGGISRLTL